MLKKHALSEVEGSTSGVLTKREASFVKGEALVIGMSHSASRFTLHISQAILRPFARCLPVRACLRAARKQVRTQTGGLAGGTF